MGKEKMTTQPNFKINALEWTNISTGMTDNSAYIVQNNGPSTAFLYEGPEEPAEDYEGTGHRMLAGADFNVTKESGSFFYVYSNDAVSFVVSNSLYQPSNT